MIEHENVKDALKEAIEIAEAEPNGTVKINEKSARLVTFENHIELIRERLYNIADLLGMSELYLGEKEKTAPLTEGTALKIKLGSQEFNAVISEIKNTEGD